MRRRGLMKSGGELKLSSTRGSCSGSATTASSFTVQYGEVALTASNVTVTSTQTWCTPTWYPSTSTVSLSVTKNSSMTSSRSTTITVGYEGQTATYTLTQTAGTLSLSPSSMTNEEPSAHAKTLYVYVNGSQYSTMSNVTVSSSGFISYTKNSTNITVTIPANETTSSRSATLTVTYGGKSVSLSVTQKADYIRGSITRYAYNIAINYTSVTNIKVLYTSNDTTVDCGKLWCSGSGYDVPSFAIYGDGTYVNGSTKSRITITYYVSGRQTTSSTTVATYSGSVTNGFSVLSIPNFKTEPSTGTKTVGNITCTLTKAAYGSYDYKLTLTYNNLSCYGITDDMCD